MNYPKCSKDLTFYEESGSIHSAPNCESKEFLKDFTCKVFSISIPSLNDWNPLKSPGVLVLKQEVNKVPYNVRLIASPKYQNGALFTSLF